MKRVAKIIVGFVMFLFMAVLLVPILFKDKIKELIIREFEKATEATVYFDLDQFGLSVIKNFPDFTVSLGDFGIVGQGIFEGDTLVHVDELEARVNLNDALFGERISIKGVDLEAPRFLIMELENGAANYDIAKESNEPAVASGEEATGVNFGINRFSISDGDLIYFDQSSGLITQLNGIDLKGRGDFENDVFDLIAAGKIDDANLIYDGTEYVANKALELDLVLNIDLPNSRYTFKENEFLINEFPLKIDGDFSMLDEGYKMDIGFSSPSTAFKQLYSLIPGTYTSTFDEIDAAGKVGFNGGIKGIYSEHLMPAFDLNLKVEDASVQYPDLPESLKNIQLDLTMRNASGVIEETVVDLKEMHVDFGQNPFDASLKVLNLKDYPIEAEIEGTMDLEDLSKMLPIKDLKLEGLLEIDAKANGKYDRVENTLPMLDINLQLENGLIQSTDLPSPIEHINLRSKVQNQTGRGVDTRILVEEFKMSMDNQPFEATAIIENPDSPTWQISGKGILDLEKIMGLYPLEGTVIKGKVQADINTSGNMKDLETKRYRRLPTSGNMSLTDFVYEDESMSQDFEIRSVETSFSTRSIEVKNFQGKAGQTALTLNGSVSNYLGFILNDERLSGNLDVSADVLNINEWMTSETEVEDDGESEPYEVIRLPENVEFILDSRIDQVLYSDLSMNEVSGKFIVKDGVLELRRARFNALNGTVAMDGKYDSRAEKPSFDFGFGIKKISIPAAFQSVSMIQKMAPVTEHMTGDFSTDFSLSGLLNQNMMPDYSSLTGQGVIQVLKASLVQSGIISELGSVSKLTNFSSASLDKVKMSAEIKEGRLFVKPFKIKLGSYETQVAGSTGIDGSLDYVLGVDVPAGEVGTQLNGLLASLTDDTALQGADIKLDLGLTGLYSDPKVTLAGVRSADGSTVSSAITASIEAKAEDKKEEVKKEVVTRVEEAKDSAEQVIDEKVDQLRDSATSTINTQLDSAANKLSDKLGIPKDSLSKELQNTKKKAEDVLKDLFKKRKKKIGKKGTGGSIQ